MPTPVHEQSGPGLSMWLPVQVWERNRFADWIQGGLLLPGGLWLLRTHRRGGSLSP